MIQMCVIESIDKRNPVYAYGLIHMEHAVSISWRMDACSVIGKIEIPIQGLAKAVYDL